MYTLKNNELIVAESDTPFVPKPDINHWASSTFRVADLNRTYTQEWVTTSGTTFSGTVESFESDWEAYFSYKTKLGKAEFKMLFTIEERLAINSVRTYSGSDTDILNKQLVLNDLFELINDSTYIDIENETTIAGINYLVSTGLLTELRAATILKGKKL